MIERCPARCGVSESPTNEAKSMRRLNLAGTMPRSAHTEWQTKSTGRGDLLSRADVRITNAPAPNRARKGDPSMAQLARCSANRGAAKVAAFNTHPWGEPPCYRHGNSTFWRRGAGSQNGRAQPRHAVVRQPPGGSRRDLIPTQPIDRMV